MKSIGGMSDEVENKLVMRMLKPQVQAFFAALINVKSWERKIFPEILHVQVFLLY